MGLPPPPKDPENYPRVLMRSRPSGGEILLPASGDIAAAVPRPINSYQYIVRISGARIGAVLTNPDQILVASTKCSPRRYPVFVDTWLSLTVLDKRARAAAAAAKEAAIGFGSMFDDHSLNSKGSYAHQILVILNGSPSISDGLSTNMARKEMAREPCFHADLAGILSLLTNID